MNERSQRPNILWICTDQQRYDTIGALGNDKVSTPNLDQLTRDGVAFERAYCQSPICTPSRASFLTGMYPSSIRVCRNGNPEFPDFPPLISKTLADAGYTCGLIGKLHLSSAYGRVEKRADDGYSYWQYSHAPRDDWREGHDYADWVRSRGADLSELIQDPGWRAGPVASDDLVRGKDDRVHGGESRAALVRQRKYLRSPSALITRRPLIANYSTPMT